MTPIILSGSIIAFFLTILLLFKKERVLSRLLLIFYFGFSAFAFLAAYLAYAHAMEFFKLFLIYVNVILTPILFLYVRQMLNPSYSFKKRDLIHGLWFAITYTYLAVTILRVSSDELTGIFNSSIADAPAGYTITMLIELTVVPVYIALMLRLILIHKRNLKQTHSFFKGVEFKWLKIFIILEFITWCTVALFSYTLAVVYPSHQALLVQLSFAVSAVLMVYFGYFGIRKTPFFSENLNSFPIPPADVTETEEEATSPDPAVETTEKMAVKKTYARSSLKEETANTKLYELQTYMEEHKPHLNPELTISTLAFALQVSSHNLSEILNTYLNTTFYDFINRYRIEEFKIKVDRLEHEKQTILALALDSGFNSKTSFNRVFKARMHQTPSQYIKKRIPAESVENKG